MCAEIQNPDYSNLLANRIETKVSWLCSTSPLHLHLPPEYAGFPTSQCNAMDNAKKDAVLQKSPKLFGQSPNPKLGEV